MRVLTRAEHERLAPLYLELEPALEHEEELILVLMLVPIDEPTVDDRETDYTVIHSRERLVDPRVVRGAFGGQVDVLADRTCRRTGCRSCPSDLLAVAQPAGLLV